MGRNVQLVVHGRGNAWPVPLGETHPFYNRNDPRDLSNASFSIQALTNHEIAADVLVDAGHGTIQSLITGSNRIPDSICLTHGHMDHTLSVDWVVQSFWRRYDRKRLYPIYATSQVYQFLVRSYPHLESLMEFRELEFGIPSRMGNAESFIVTAYPAFHGQGAAGASMLLFGAEGRRVLFTGDLLLPLLREQDYHELKNVDLLVVDSNNRFPWPRTNHWSFAGHPSSPDTRGEVLSRYLEQLTWEKVVEPHTLSSRRKAHRTYFQQLKSEWNVNRQATTILEFLHRITPGVVVPVHYSGAEDQRHYHEQVMTGRDLLSWASAVARNSGIDPDFLVPQPGQVIQVQMNENGHR